MSWECLDCNDTHPGGFGYCPVTGAPRGEQPDDATRIDGGLRILEPSSTSPPGPREGDAYYNIDTGKIRVWSDGVWADFTRGPVDALAGIRDE